MCPELKDCPESPPLPYAWVHQLNFIQGMCLPVASFPDMGTRLVCGISIVYIVASPYYAGEGGEVKVTEGISGRGPNFHSLGAVFANCTVLESSTVGYACALAKGSNVKAMQCHVWNYNTVRKSSPPPPYLSTCTSTGSFDHEDESSTYLRLFIPPLPHDCKPSHSCPLSWAFVDHL